MSFNSVDINFCDTEFCIADNIHETLLNEEIILLNGDTEGYIGLQDSARVIWEIIKKYKTITVNQLILQLAEEWVISTESKNYIDITLSQLFKNKIIVHAKK